MKRTKKGEKTNKKHFLAKCLNLHCPWISSYNELCIYFIIYHEFYIGVSFLTSLMITSQHHLIWISVRTPLHTFPWYTFNKLQEQIKGLEMKLNCWVESQALGRVQVPHTKVPQAQKKNLKQNLGFPAQEEDLTKSFLTCFCIFATQVLVKSLPNAKPAFSFAENHPGVLIKNTGKGQQCYPLPQQQLLQQPGEVRLQTPNLGDLGWPLSNLHTHCSPLSFPH